MKTALRGSNCFSFRSCWPVRSLGSNGFQGKVPALGYTEQHDDETARPHGKRSARGPESRPSQRQPKTGRQERDHASVRGISEPVESEGIGQIEAKNRGEGRQGEDGVLPLWGAATPGADQAENDLAGAGHEHEQRQAADAIDVGLEL